jgi:hypothetical protein
MWSTASALVLVLSTIHPRSEVAAKMADYYGFVILTRILL